jgi:histidine triad (HIT) family protein
MVKECIFCKMVSGKISINKIYENDNFFSIPDANQKIEGHSLVISKKHFETVLDMPLDVGADFFDCVKKTASKLMKQEKAEGFNIVSNNFEVAGQVVKHVHFHILPRKKGDKIPHVY